MVVFPHMSIVIMMSMCGIINQKAVRLRFQKEVGVPFTARRKGETASIGTVEGYSSELSGSVDFTLKKKIEVKVGYTFTKHEAFYVGATSAKLKKNQTVRRYYRKCYMRTPVILKEIKKTYKNGQVIRSKETGRTKLVYAYKAVGPDFLFRYF